MSEETIEGTWEIIKINRRNKVKYDIENMTEEELWKQYNKYRVFADEVIRRDILAREEELKNKPPAKKRLDLYNFDNHLRLLMNVIDTDYINPINEYFTLKMLDKYNLERYGRNSGLRVKDSKEVIFEAQSRGRAFVVDFLNGFIEPNRYIGLHLDKQQIEINRFPMFSFNNEKTIESYRKRAKNNLRDNNNYDLAADLLEKIEQDAYDYYIEMIEIHILPFLPKWYFQLKANDDVVDQDDASYNLKTEEWVDYYREENKYDEIAYH